MMDGTDMQELRAQSMGDASCQRYPTADDRARNPVGPRYGGGSVGSENDARNGPGWEDDMR
ncbi:hypothetical protein ColLi_05196 [Colletotrichum liriopes]|uniref:Uncharacterized protein n=1 Tax=Colletotrichum liriopes TaxID=708192 RepID=A0AA37GLE9_9PEZI|nr:hypothetical protein ColLi_05196 [Colletotrichum liriopes]